MRVRGEEICSFALLKNEIGNMFFAGLKTRYVPHFVRNEIVLG
jgi:hypothetical protein